LPTVLPLQDKDADNLAAKIKLGHMACELAPDWIEKQPLSKIQVNLTALAAAKVAIPIGTWLVLIKKTCWDHLDAERFDKFLQTFRPWSLPSDPKALTNESGFPGLRVSILS
jgi:hypothetical protein